MHRIAEFSKVSKNIYANEGYEDIILPRRATKGSAGYDFFAPCDFVIPKNGSVIVKTGIRAKIDEDWVLCIFPRSGMGFKYGVRLANTAGIIDSDYYGAENEGHIMIKLTGTDEDVFVPKGKAFAQGIFLPYGITVDDNCFEERTGGLGSTDRK